jgi:hypothetical protein
MLPGNLLYGDLTPLFPCIVPIILRTAPGAPLTAPSLFHIAPSAPSDLQGVSTISLMLPSEPRQIRRKLSVLLCIISEVLM